MIFIDTYIVGKVLRSLKVTVKGQEVGGRRLMRTVLFSFMSYQLFNWYKLT